VNRPLGIPAARTAKDLAINADYVATRQFRDVLYPVQEGFLKFIRV
jgi:hypothetical protein